MDLPVALPTVADQTCEDFIADRAWGLNCNTLADQRTAFAECMYMQRLMRDGDRADACIMADLARCAAYDCTQIEPYGPRDV